MSRILRTLLAGVAGRADWVLGLARPENGFEIVGLCDVDETALLQAAARLGLPAPACHRDLATAIRQTVPDCLVICAPTRFHVPMAMQGIDAGLAVLTEKGMAPDWENARALVKYASERDALLCVAQNYRYKTVERTVAACLRGELAGNDPGKIAFGDLIHHRVRPEPRTLNYPFASVWDMSCHHFDNLLSWLGAPLAMTAHAFGAPWSAYTHPNNTSALIEFRSGARIHYFHGHDSARGLFHLSLHGEHGAVVTDDRTVEFSARPRGQFGTCPARQISLPDIGPAEQAVLRDFHRYVTAGIEPGISGRHNLEVMAMCEMCVLSAQQKRRVERAEIG